MSSEDDELPISQMVAKRRAKRTNNAPPPKQAPKTKQASIPERPANTRRSRRLQSSSPPIQEQPIVKKKPIKKKAKQETLFSPRKTRSHRKTANKETTSLEEETLQEESTTENEQVVEDKKEQAESSKVAPKQKDEDVDENPEDEVDHVSIKPKEDNDAMDVDKDEEKQAASKKEHNDVMDVGNDESKPPASVSNQPQVDSGAKEDLESKEGNASINSNDREQDSSKDNLPDKIVATAPSVAQRESLEDGSKAAESNASNNHDMSSGSEEMIVDDQVKQDASREAAASTAVEMTGERQRDALYMDIDKILKDSAVPSDMHIDNDAVATAETAPTPPADNTNDDLKIDDASRKEEQPIEDVKRDSQEPPGDTAFAETLVKTATEVDESATMQKVKESAPTPAEISVAEKGKPVVQDKAISQVNEDMPPTQDSKRHGDVRIRSETLAESKGVEITPANDEETTLPNDELAKGSRQQKFMAPPTATIQVTDTASKDADAIVKLIETKKAVPVENTGPSKQDQATNATVEATSPLDLLANVANKHDSSITDESSRVAETNANPLDLLAAAIADTDGDTTRVVADNKDQSVSMDQPLVDKPNVTKGSDTVVTDHANREDENLQGTTSVENKPSMTPAPLKVTDTLTGEEAVDKPTTPKSVASVEAIRQDELAMKDAPVESAPPKLETPVATADSSEATPRKMTEDFAPTTNPNQEKVSAKADKMEAVDPSIFVAVKDSETRREPTDDLAGPKVEVKEQTEKEESFPFKEPSSPSMIASVQENVESTVAVGKSTESKTKVSGPTQAPAAGTDAKPLVSEHQHLSCDVTSNTSKTDVSVAHANIDTSHRTASASQQYVMAIGDVATTIDVVLVGTTGFTSPPDTKMLNVRGDFSMRGVGVEAEGVGIFPKSTKGPPQSSAGGKPAVVPDEKTPAVDVFGASESSVLTEEHAPVNESQNESQRKGNEATTSKSPDTSVSTKPTETDVFEAKIGTGVPFKLDDSIESSLLGDNITGAVPMELDAITGVNPSPTEASELVDHKEKITVEVDPYSVSKVENHDIAEDDSRHIAKKAKTSMSTGGRIVSVVYQPPTAQETAELINTFPSLKKQKSFSNSRSKKRSRKQLSIRISVTSDTSKPEALKSAVSVGSDSIPQGTKATLSPNELHPPREVRCYPEHEDDPSQYERDFEESLEFFGETHEEQDPVYIESRRSKDESRLKLELANIKKEYEAGVMKINEVITSQIKEKQANVEKTLPQLVTNQSLEEQRDLRRLKEAYVQKLKLHSSKVSESIQRMTAHHSKEMQKAHLQHRQQAQQRGIPQEVASSEWGPLAQRLQAKQQQQMKDFNTSGENLKKTIEAEYQREKEKYVAFYEKKRKDLQEKVQKAVARIRNSFQLQQQRYVKALTLRLKTKREELRSLLAESNVDNRAQGTDATKDNESEDNMELRSPSPVKLRVPLTADFDESNDSPSASSRSRHRKIVLNTLHKQLSVEIHNEGLWISALPEKQEDSNKAKEADSSGRNKCEFIPWGNKARSILYSIVCGEIPSGYGSDRFDFGHAVANQGGHIRCAVVDLRTSEETASAQRAVAMKKHEADCIKALEEKVEKLSRTVAEAELHGNKAAAEERQVLAYHEKAAKEVEKANDMIKQLRSKFKNLLGPDDLPLPKLNPSDTQKLTNAMKKCNSHLESAQSRLKIAESALEEKKSRTQKMATLVKQATKASTAAATSLKKKRAQISENKSGRSKGRLSETMETDRASTRVADTIGALQKAAEMRREQLSQKRGSAGSSAYAQSLPDLPNALKNSLWHKMHRRRKQIALRPSMDFVLSDLKETVEASVVYAKDRSSRNHPTKEDVSVRSEQLFLLAAFPEQGSEPLPSTSPSNSHTAWGEPGWKLNLEVQKEGRESRSLLPCVPVSSIMQQNHSEMSSAPGRQAASLMRTTHLQSLCTPLSAAGQAVSLAEITPVSKEVKLSENDPFNGTEHAITTGYTFALRSSPSRSASQSRRKQTPKVEEPVPPHLMPTPPKPRPKPSVLKPKPGPVAPEVPAQVPISSPPKRSSSTGSRRPSAVAEQTPESKPKRSRPMSSTGMTPRKKSKQSLEAAAAADVASQARSFMQQAAANALYGQQQHASTVATMDQAAQYSPSYMKQMAQNQVNLQALPPQQLQQAMTAQQQQQLLPQPPYGSPQQFQQRHLAQMRLMQQQVQQQSRANFSQQQANMQFFNPAAMQVAAAAQQQFGVQQAPHMPLPGQQRLPASSEENRNDPLFMLPPPPPPPPQP